MVLEFLSSAALDDVMTPLAILEAAAAEV